ncbi:MAG: ribulose-phosphate 3-epimerase [Bacillota bacterium]|jgi:ribulose-phosphate 3-epimerase
MTIAVAPSIVSAPMENLGKAIAELEAAQADYIHFDVEDGSFVPEINLGIKIIEGLRGCTSLPFEVHLMMYNPEWLIPRLAKCGADMISVHYEACPYPRRTLGMIKKYGLKAGLAFNPKTPVPNLDYFKPHLDYVIILTTEPELGDCPLLPDVLDKVRYGKQENDPKLLWFVDGGVTPDNIGLVAQCGADVVVSGRGVFSGGKIRENISRLKQGI